jgi:Activator of Hsp90 ATPase homolog 1-like protein
MSTQDYTTTFLVDQTPDEAFAAITNVRGWWSGQIDGSTDSLGDVFTYRYKDVHYSKQELVEVVPGRRVVWRIRDACLQFTEDKNEWNGTKVIFEMSRKGDKTAVRFTHEGLVPQFECFDKCSDAWGFYINTSLRNLIATGKGDPNPQEPFGGCLTRTF